MRDFFYRISAAISRFMYGRNGNDRLNIALLAVYVAALVVRALLSRIASARMVLELVCFTLALLILYRAFSRNLDKRRTENEKFLHWWRPVEGRFLALRSRSLDKEHKYFTCKSCKTVCRVPAGKGKIEITCPKCGGKIMGKS